MTEHSSAPDNGDTDPLGTALGNAIGAEVDDAYVPPPVTDIAARAEAKAKARATRRTVGSVAASLAILAGGIVGYSQIRDDDGEGTVAVAPNVDEGPAAAETDLAAPAEAAADTSEFVEDPLVGGVEDFELPVPGDVSTGPTLTWTEIEAPFEGGAMVEATSDGRFLARSYAGSGVDLYLSSDGRSWDLIPPPPSTMLEQIDVSGDTYAATAWNAETEGSVAYLSQDAGASWTELDTSPFIGAEPSAPWMTRNSYVAGILVGGGDLVLVVGTYTNFDFSTLLLEQGLIEDDQQIWGYGWGDGVVTVEIGPADGEDFSEEASFPEPVEFTYEELGLSADDIQALEGRGAGLDESVVLFSDNGGPLEEVERFTGSPSRATKAGDGYVIGLFGEEGPEVLVSGDGRSWQRLTGPDSGDVIGAPDGSLWSLGWEPGFSIRRAGALGDSFELVASFPALDADGLLSVGPSGLAATARPGVAPGASPDAETFPTGSVVKDGYELRYNDPIGGISLYDVETGEAIYVFDEEATNAAEPPEGVIEREGPEDFALTFVDPDTGDELVSFLADDLYELWGLDESILESTSDFAAETSSYSAPETWIGWSADGTAWGWQTIQEAFGIDASEAWASVAVGDGVILASVEVYDEVEAFTESVLTEEEAAAIAEEAVDPSFEQQPPRWFVAEVPG